MKKIRLFLSASLLAAMAAACNDDAAVPVNNPSAACLPQSLQSGLIAAYPFGNSGFNDVAGNADLTASLATPASDRDGNTNCAVQFQGNDYSYLMTQDTNWFNNLNEFSIALWYQPLGTQNGYELLAGRGDGLHCPDTFGEWSVGLHDMRRAVFGHGNSVWEQPTASGVTDAWKFVTVTCNKADNTLKIYMNGQLMETKTGLGNCGIGPVTVSDMGNFYIGTNFNGKIDDVVIYNRVLAPAEINSLFELDPCCGG